jgi:hypothetical protein
MYIEGRILTCSIPSKDWMLSALYADFFISSLMIFGESFGSVH